MGEHGGIRRGKKMSQGWKGGREGDPLLTGKITVEEGKEVPLRDQQHSKSVRAGYSFSPCH